MGASVELPRACEDAEAACMPCEEDDEGAQGGAGDASANAGAEAAGWLDYHHVSSVSVSATTGDYIVASRNLDTVWCLKRDGSGALWTLSV